MKRLYQERRSIFDYMTPGDFVRYVIRNDEKPENLERAWSYWATQAKSTFAEEVLNTMERIERKIHV